MKNIINFPNKKYLNDVKNILYEKEIDISNKTYDFNSIRRAIYNNENLLKLLNSQGINNTIEISSGTSDQICWKKYKDQIIEDLKNDNYYREYTTAQGNIIARKAIAFMENQKGNLKYSASNICLTEGATGAITCVFEFLQQQFPNGEIIIPVPNYYIYKFSAKYFKLKYKEIYPEPTIINKSFISIDRIISTISKNTKLIILTNPANPNGEIYQEEDLIKLLKIAKKNNIYILVDELFSELVFPDQKFVYSDNVAAKLKCLNNIIIVKGYSKTKNLPGLRIGYVLSKNNRIINSVSLISQQRQCFPVASNFTGLIYFDSLVQSIFILNKKNKNLKKIISNLLIEFPKIDYLQKNKITQLLKNYYQYRKYRDNLLKFYSENYDYCLSLLSENTEISQSKQSAFNTFVKIKNLNKVNMFDFLLNLYITCGIKIEISPGFGLNQKKWENTPNLGFWLRITFAKDKKIMSEGITKFLEFKKIYLTNRTKFLKTNLYF